MLYFSKFKSISILLICLLGIIFAFPNLLSTTTLNALPKIIPHKQINLGLDLRGGSHLLVEVQSSVRATERMDDLYDEIRIELRRNKILLSDISQSNNQLKITLSDDGFKGDLLDIIESLSQNVRGQLGTAELADELDIMEQIDGSILVSMTEEAKSDLLRRSVDQSIEIIRRRIDELGTKEPTIQRQGDSRILIQVPGLDDPKRLKDLLGTTAKMTFHLIDPFYDGGNVSRSSMQLKHANNESTYVVERRSIIGGENLVDAQPGFDSQTNQPIVNFRFDGQGSRKFGKITTDNVGKLFAIVLDNEVISAPIINEPILGGSGMISGSFTVQEANDLAILLRAGALPAPLVILEERTVGPGLGADSIKSGQIASILGLLLVLIYMFVSYGRFGIYSNISLLINLSLIVAVLSILQATLTLPGIAGIILTIGMAVDANVLIFERIREEISNKKSVINAIDNGYKRARTTILDANITHLYCSNHTFSIGVRANKRVFDYTCNRHYNISFYRVHTDKVSRGNVDKKIKSKRN